MKSTLEFQLPDEAHYHQQAVKGLDWYIFACNLDERVRSRLKYHDLTPEERAAYENCRDWIIALLDEAGLQIHQNNQ